MTDKHDLQAGISELCDTVAALRDENHNLREALKYIRFNWAGHSEACASVFAHDCDCDWPKVKRIVDAALEEKDNG